MEPGEGVDANLLDATLVSLFVDADRKRKQQRQPTPPSLVAWLFVGFLALLWSLNVLFFKRLVDQMPHYSLFVAQARPILFAVLFVGGGRGRKGGRADV